MIVQLNRGKDKFCWECDNGGQLWQTDEDRADTLAVGDEIPIIPSAFCRGGFGAVYAAFVGGLVIDLACQVRCLEPPCSFMQLILCSAS